LNYFIILLEFYFFDKSGFMIHLFVNLTQVTLYIPKSQWTQSNGVLINGFVEPLTTTDPSLTTSFKTDTANSSIRRAIKMNSFYSCLFLLFFTLTSSYLILFLILNN